MMRKLLEAVHRGKRRRLLHSGQRMSQSQLAALRDRVESGAIEASAELRAGLVDRIDDLATAIIAAQTALAVDRADAVDVVARRLVSCKVATGPAWRRYLAEMDPTYTILGAVDRALAADAAALHVALISRLPKTRAG